MRPAVATVVLHGELDVTTLADLRGLLDDAAVRSPGRLVIVLADVSFVDLLSLAAVFRAVDVRLARAVAVKLFRGDAAEQLQRHEAEMRTLASLDHPSLVAVYDAGEDDGQPYLVMQLVEGDTLAEELRRGPLA